MPGNFRQHVESFVWYDALGSGANPIAPYQIVCLATSAEVATAQGNGVKIGGAGDMCIAAPVAANLSTRRILGVTLEAAKNGETVQVVTGGIAHVQAAAAITGDGSTTFLQAYLAETRTNLQTPFINNGDMTIKADPSLTFTYQLCLAGRTAIVPAAGATANAIYYPLGYAIEVATAKYDVIAVELDPKILYA